MAAIETVGARLSAATLGQDRGSIRVRLGGSGEPSFKDTLQKALGEVSSLQEEAQDAISAYLRGDPVELHNVVAAAEEAGIALDMLIQLRNKLTEAYRSVMQMQS